MRIISFIDQADLIKKILQHLGYGKNLTPVLKASLPEKK